MTRPRHCESLEPRLQRHDGPDDEVFPPQDVPNLGTLDLTSRNTIAITGLADSQHIEIRRLADLDAVVEQLLGSTGGVYPRSSTDVYAYYDDLATSLRAESQLLAFAGGADRAVVRSTLASMMADAPCYVIESADDGEGDVVIPATLVKRFNIDAGGGNDFVQDFDRRRPVRMYGSDGDDTLISCGSGDVLCGNGGADVIVATGASATLVGGGGDDRLTAFETQSVLTGGAGRDRATCPVADSVVGVEMLELLS